MKITAYIQTRDTIQISIYAILAAVCATLLTKFGNPIDGGISISCFLRDIAGALGMHEILQFSYIRPEIIAIVFGSTIIVMLKKGFQPTASSYALMYLVIGMVMAFSIFVFVGCPMRLVLRLAGGDPSALFALPGFIFGIWIATHVLEFNFTPAPKQKISPIPAGLFHCGILLLAILLILKPLGITLTHSRHAPLLASLVFGSIFGIAAQQGKLCFVSGFRNVFLIRDFTWLVGTLIFIITALVINAVLGQLHIGKQVIGSDDLLWNFLSMVQIGMASTFIGGCPLRQLICASQGNTDSALCIIGITIGASLAYNLNIAFSGGSLELIGKIAVGGGIILLLVIGMLQRGQK